MSEVPECTFPDHLCDHLTIKDNVAPVQFVEVEPKPVRNLDLEDRVMLYTIHGGDVLYPKYRAALDKLHPTRECVDNELLEGYCIEKDWGCNQVAAQLASHLGLKGFWRVNVARVLMDFGRFPGITGPGAQHLTRFAINYPFSYMLDLQAKRDLLETCYDTISSSFEAATEGKLLKIAVHSYDPYNPVANRFEERTLRPEMSILFRSQSVEDSNRMPHGVFDRLYPNELGQFTADRKLAARMSLTLEKAGISVSHNYPYLMPDGSVEVRTQVWFFFTYLRKLFNNTFPQTKVRHAYQMVWNMLQDTNLRSSASESLRSYLHMFRRPPYGQEILFREAEEAYDHISTFLQENRQEVVHKFRTSPYRLSSLGIEVRKDMIWKFKDRFARKPIFGAEGAKRENINRISNLTAHAIATYFQKDRHVHPGDPAERFHLPERPADKYPGERAPREDLLKANQESTASAFPGA